MTAPGSKPTNKPHIRIETKQTDPEGGARLGGWERYVYVAGDGTETDITLGWKGVEIKMVAGEIHSALFTATCFRVVDVDMESAQT